MIGINPLCPYCYGKNCVPSEVYQNSSATGNENHQCECKYCGKVISVSTKITAVVTDVRQAPDGAESEY